MSSSVGPGRTTNSLGLHPTKLAAHLSMGDTVHPRRRHESATPPDTWLRARSPTLWSWRCALAALGTGLERDSAAARIAWLSSSAPSPVARLTAGMVFGWLQPLAARRRAPVSTEASEPCCVDAPPGSLL